MARRIGSAGTPILATLPVGAWVDSPIVDYAGMDDERCESFSIICISI
jgi:hypothetical protein